MDRCLAHKYLEIGLDLYSSFNFVAPNAEDNTVGMFSLDRDNIDTIFTTHTGAELSRDEHIELFDLVFESLGRVGELPSAFGLAMFYYTRYMSRVNGLCGMDDTGSVKTIPN